jgi:gluconokinase
MPGPRHIVVMGVSGTGKTTIGRAVADRMGGAFVEGDEYHPPANIQKMSSGTPLNDDDRRPWLEALAAEISRLGGQGEISVTACSALRRIYRDWLRQGDPDLFFLHLHTDYDVLLARMEQRDHFMPPSLLQSQFDTLEMLAGDERGAVIDDSLPVEGVIASSLAALKAAGCAVPDA